MNIIATKFSESAKILSSYPSLGIVPAAAGVRVAQIGWGFHPDRTYVPHINEMRSQGHDVQLCAVVDTTAARDAVMARAAKHATPPELTFIEPFSVTMPAKAEVVLNRLVDHHRINALVVATNPEAHAAYISWGLRRNISVLTDKPVTTRPDAVNNISAARGIKDDIRALIGEYKQARRRERVCVIVNAQRRWHPAFDFACELVEDVRRRRECPITSLYAFHADGQWRLPDELVDISYHGFDNGAGKISHSGYHEIDMMFRLLRAGWTPENKPDRAQMSSSLVQPLALLNHIPRRQLVEMFGADFDTASRYTNAELSQIGSRMGEIDALLRIELQKAGTTVGLASIGLHHNSVSARSWLRPRENLYKQMGRLKHEQWIIMSGPYQTITIETRQAEDQHDRQGEKSHELGGPNHLDIEVIRNTAMLGGGKKLEVIRAHELSDFSSERLHSEQVKMAALRELVSFVQGKISHAELRSDLTDHIIPASLMSAAYESHVRRRAGRNGFVTVKL